MLAKNHRRVNNKCFSKRSQEEQKSELQGKNCAVQSDFFVLITKTAKWDFFNESMDLLRDH